jgi:hypothetical protein
MGANFFNEKIMRLFNLNWLLNSNSNLNNGRYYCPKCLTKVIDIDDKTTLPTCVCGWSGNVNSLLNLNEIQSKKRLKLIDEMIKK